MPDEQIISTERLTRLLKKDEDYDNDAIIHFSSCYFEKPDGMEKLLEGTGALSVSGYMKKNEGVGWNQSAAFELLFLATLFEFVSFKRKKIGIPDESVTMRDFVIDKYLKDKALVALGNKLGFRMWYDVRDGKIDITGHPTNITPCESHK